MKTLLLFAICKVLSPDGEVLLETKPLYPIRSSTLVRVHDDYFLELRYQAVGSFVRVYQLKMPHAPWTFGESMLEETDLKLSPDTREGEISIDPIMKDGVLSCQVR